MKSKKSSSKTMLILTLVITLIAGLLSNFLILAFVPVLGGVIAVLGQIYNKRSQINVGMTVAILSFFLLNYNLSFNLINLSMILIVFIGMMVIWAFARHNLMSAEIRKDLDEDDDNKYLKEFELKSTSKLAKKMIIALVLGFIGSFIALSSYTGTLLVRSLAVPLALFFAGIFLVILYILTVYLPKYSEAQNEEL